MHFNCLLFIPSSLRIRQGPYLPFFHYCVPSYSWHVGEHQQVFIEELRIGIKLLQIKLNHIAEAQSFFFFFFVMVGGGMAATNG